MLPATDCPEFSLGLGFTDSRKTSGCLAVV